MYAMKYVLRKQYGVFIGWIVFAAFFHKTILVVIPIYLIAAWLANHRVYKWMYVVLGAFLVSLVVFRNFYRKLIFIFYPYPFSDITRWSAQIPRSDLRYVLRYSRLCL